MTYSSMTPEMEESAAQIAINAVTNNQLEEDIAEIVKQVSLVYNNNRRKVFEKCALKRHQNHEG